MMVNGRLVGLVPESRRYVALSVGLQWVALVANVCLITAVCRLLGRVLERSLTPRDLAVTTAVALLAVVVRALCASGASWASSRARRTAASPLVRALLAVR